MPPLTLMVLDALVDDWESIESMRDHGEVAPYGLALVDDGAIVDAVRSLLSDGLVEVTAVAEDPAKLVSVWRHEQMKPVCVATGFGRRRLARRYGGRGTPFSMHTGTPIRPRGAADPQENEEGASADGLCDQPPRKSNSPPAPSEYPVPARRLTSGNRRNLRFSADNCRTWAACLRFTFRDVRLDPHDHLAELNAAYGAARSGAQVPALQHRGGSAGSGARSCVVADGRRMAA
jgi:hypothetical protein